MDIVVPQMEPLLKSLQQVPYLYVLATVAHWEDDGYSHSLPVLPLLPEPSRALGAEPQDPLNSAMAGSGLM